ncbi:ER membrane protein complex subunit 3-like [Cimex lectularius]|uniref:ER membrane protein complex subunit 3 n=1 Tax=Cimex lectularius TaxID=79782 RepID=A0A8I6SDW9_CIMLE|nr:ER membrane protein complex subunit 3-like [Cimex lectularius]
MTELLVDPEIRSWVFLPIVLITFFVGIVRHYMSQITALEKKCDVKDVSQSHMISRGRILASNGLYLTKEAFEMRRHYFNNQNNGCFKVLSEKPRVQNPMMTDPGAVSDMLKVNLTNALPMLIIGGWINFMFSGFIATRVPFPLTLRFKPMLQRGIELMSLDPAWVSSASWYFLNVFGLSSIYRLVLGEDPYHEMNQFQPTAQPPEIKAEWEALEIYQHKWQLADAHKRLMD